jgi:hypothetical protein
LQKPIRCHLTSPSAAYKQTITAAEYMRVAKMCDAVTHLSFREAIKQIIKKVFAATVVAVKNL